MLLDTVIYLFHSGIKYRYTTNCGLYELCSLYPVANVILRRVHPPRARNPCEMSPEIQVLYIHSNLSTVIELDWYGQYYISLSPALHSMHAHAYVTSSFTEYLLASVFT